MEQNTLSNDVYKLAFGKVCKFLREHPPSDACDYIELTSLVMNGASDPKGIRWALYFIQQVLDDLEKENVNGN